VGGLPEIIDDGIDGYLIDGHDPQLFAQKCAGILKDPEKLECMSAAAENKIENRFSAKRMAVDYFRLYARLVHKPGKRDQCI
jgi:glycosyltransferase involved in cell wall biosynthesis